MKYILERVVGPGDFESVGEHEIDEPSSRVAPEVLTVLAVTEVASYRIYPEGFEQDAGFWNLTMDGTVQQVEVPAF
jgi:hypothetical protein